MVSEGETVWKDLVRSIRGHRAPRARFFKPVCVICAIDLADEGLLDPLNMDIRAIENRFRRYVTVIHPARAGQGWRPIFHLSVDGLWHFWDQDRRLMAEDFGPEKKPGGRTQFYN